MKNLKTVTLLAESLAVLVTLVFTTGDAAAQGAPAAASAAEVGRHLSNPTSDVWALFTEFDYTKYNGTLTGGEDSKTVGFSMIFQPITPIPLTRNWKLLTRPVIPIIFSTPVPGVDGAGINFDRKSGLGDIALPLILAKNHGIKLGKGRLIGGVGPTFQFPTATNDALGSETWETGIAGLAVYKTPKWIWIANPQYWWSTGRSDDDAPHTSHGSLLYGVFYEAGNAWQVGLSPTITYDAEASSGNRWNVPIGLMVAKTTKIGKRMIKFQVAFEYSVVNQDAYGKEFMLRFNVIPVVTSPFSKPLF